MTLNYITFTDKLENTLLGGYIYPDEGNVFLRADITVKNIGTENGDLLTAWNTIVYDSVYEFLDVLHELLLNIREQKRIKFTGAVKVKPEAHLGLNVIIHPFIH